MKFSLKVLPDCQRFGVKTLIIFLLSLGGDEITDVVTNYLGREFKNKYKEDILGNKRAKIKLSLEAEKVKHVLSTLGKFYFTY